MLNITQGNANQNYDTTSYPRVRITTINKTAYPENLLDHVELEYVPLLPYQNGSSYHLTHFTEIIFLNLSLLIRLKLLLKAYPRVLEPV